ncbi:MAG: SMC-Scp complex subunit ScpB [Deltaproteobacteria bacterium]|nr:SMC-Scp complex subunit ScpB [Deltaproteobacteria bacterium]
MDAAPVDPLDPEVRVAAEGFTDVENAEHDPAFDSALRSETADATLAADDAPGETEARIGDGDVDVEAEAAPEAELDPKAAAKAAREKEEARRMAVVRRELGKLVEDAFAALTVAYADPNRSLCRGVQLVEVAGGYQLRTASAVAPFVRHFLQVKPTKLTRAQLEIMAIIAYRQPVTRPEIEQIRGVDCGAGLKVLLDRRLVRILGKKEEVGRPLLYGTSKEFLEFFRLGSLLELPTLREFQELTDEHRKQVDEALAVEAPLGNLRDLVETAESTFVHDDSALIQDLDQALTGARQTVNRVAELTGLRKDEDEPMPPPQDPGQS